MPNYTMVPMTNDDLPDSFPPTGYNPSPAIPPPTPNYGPGSSQHYNNPNSNVVGGGGQHSWPSKEEYLQQEQQHQLPPPPNQPPVMPDHDPPPPYAPCETPLPPQQQYSYQSSYYPPPPPTGFAHHQPHMPPVITELPAQIVSGMHVQIPWAILGTQAALALLLFISSFMYSPNCYQFYFLTKGNYVLIPTLGSLFTLLTIKRNKALIQCSNRCCCNKRPEGIHAYGSGAPLFWTGLLLGVSVLVSLDAMVGIGCEAKGAELVSKEYPAQICRLLTLNNPHPSRRYRESSNNAQNGSVLAGGTFSSDNYQAPPSISDKIRADHNATAHAIEQINESTCYFQYLKKDYDYLRTKALLLNVGVMILGLAMVSVVLFELVKILKYRSVQQR